MQDVALTKATVKKLELQVESLKRALEEKVSWDRFIPFSQQLVNTTHSHTHYITYRSERRRD